MSRSLFRSAWVRALCAATFLVALSAATPHSTDAAPIATDELAQELVQLGGVERGLCVVLGTDNDLALGLADASELLIHVRGPDAAQVDSLRARAAEAGYGLRRMTVEKGTIGKLPHADNMVDVVIVPQVTNESLTNLSVGDIARALRPEGTAVVGSATGEVDAAKLQEWASTPATERVAALQDESGTWVHFRKPPLAGAGDWPHWEHGPDNNPVANDQVIKAPYMTQYLARPFYIPMPSVTTAAGGRTFLATGHITHHRREWDWIYKLIARNGYNGTILWERRLSEGYLVHRSAFIATKDTFYLLDGNGALRLDPQTGVEMGRVRIPGVGGEWKWMVLKDGILYAMAGKKGKGVIATRGDRSFGGWSWGDMSRGYYAKTRVPFGYGKTVAAYDINAGTRLWIHREETTMDSRAMAMIEDKLFLFCPERHVRAINARTGEEIWTNSDESLVTLIEEPGKGLRSTPGFRTQCIAVATPEALIIQGQTRMNVIALSTEDGSLLWTKKKITNNPNAIYVDGNVIIGVGEGASHVVLEPTSGKVLADLKFKKTACTRLTASSDSFFVRGEGTLRFDRYFRKVLIDGAQRPACNDGALPANGLLYLGPWQCDCNLSLIGNVAKCSAGNFDFDLPATDNLEKGEDADSVVALKTTSGDWPTYRADVSRSSSTSVEIPEKVTRSWEFTPDSEYLPTPATAAGNLVFSAGNNGQVRAISAADGAVRWTFSTPCPVKQAPTIADGRAYFGSGDGYVYALEATSGRLLWRFRAAPMERHIMVYDELSSTWPVHTGVLVHEGVAYFAAGIIDHDGTYVYALDAKSGEIIWQNNSSGHLSKELRKGVSAQGNLAIQGDRLLLAGGNQISPAPFDLKTGKCLAKEPSDGRPRANNGHFIGVFNNGTPIAGGRTLYSSPRNVATKGSFQAYIENETASRSFRFNYGGIPPSWSDGTLAVVNYKHGFLTCHDANQVTEYLAREEIEARTIAEEMEGVARWSSNLGEDEKFEALSIVVAGNSVAAVVHFQNKFRAQGQWYLVAFNLANGERKFRAHLDGEPLPGGLLVNRHGQLVVTMLDGSLQGWGPAPEEKNDA